MTPTLIPSKEIKNTNPTNLVEIKPKKSHLFQKGHPKMGGKKKGQKNKATIEKEMVRKEMEDAILREVRELIDSQKRLAKGTSYLYKIVTHKDGKREHVLVDDPMEIKDFLDELEGNEGTLPYNDDWYYIATKEPNNQALDSLLNRVFGKPKESIDFGGEIKTIQIKELVLTTRQILELKPDVSQSGNNTISPEQIQE